MTDSHLKPWTDFNSCSPTCNASILPLTVQYMLMWPVSHLSPVGPPGSVHRCAIINFNRILQHASLLFYEVCGSIVSHIHHPQHNCSQYPEGDSCSSYVLVFTELFVAILALVQSAMWTPIECEVLPPTGLLYWSLDLPVTEIIREGTKP